MRNNETKVPKLRFPGFDGEWEVRKGDELFIEYIDKGHPELPVLSASQEYGMIKREDAGINILHDAKNESGYKRVLPGQFVIHLRSFQGGFAHSKMEGITSPAYTVFGFKKVEGQNDDFWKYVFSSGKFIKRLETITYGIRDGRSISFDEFLSMKFHIPCYEEQKKISQWMEQLNKCINLHRHKIDDLQKLKYGLLQKMFPKDGEKVPEIRFQGFVGEWSELKLGDLGIVEMNKRIFKDQTSEVGEIPFYKIGTFGGEPDAFISRKLFEEYKTKYPYPNLGDILISASGSIGRTVEYMGKDEYFQDSNIVWLNHDERLDNSFLKQFYFIVRWQGLEGSTIKRLYNKNILETQISLPAIGEQKKIGFFFKQFDDVITLHQRKLNHLQQLKKGLQQQMFV